MQPGSVQAIYDSVFRPLFTCAVQNVPVEHSTELFMKLAEEQKRLDEKFQTGFGLKMRPCIISDNISKELLRPDSEDTEMVPILLMATFAGNGLDTLSSMHQSFCAPVLTTGQNPHFRDYFSYINPFEKELSMDRRFISTTPKWRTGRRNTQQYIICYEHLVPVAKLSAWHCTDASEYMLDSDNQFKLEILCRVKEKGWIIAAKSHSGFYDSMIIDLLNYRHSPKCEDKQLFDSCASYKGKGYQSRDNYRNSRVTVDERAMSTLYETPNPNIYNTPLQATDTLPPPPLVSNSCLFPWSPELGSTEYIGLERNNYQNWEQTALESDHNSNFNLQLKENNRSRIEISSRDSLILRNFRFPVDKSSSQISIERPPSERSCQSTWSVVSSKRGRKGRRISGAGSNFTKRFGISKVRKD